MTRLVQMSDKGRGPSVYVELAEKLVVVERERDAALAKQAKLTEVEATCAVMRECLESALRVRRADPLCSGAVRRLGEEVGYGAMMGEASRQWAEGPAGVGAFAAGPRIGTIQLALTPAAGKALLAEVTEYRQLKMRRGQQCDACTRGDHPNCSEWCYCLCGTDPGKALLAEVEALRECADVLRGWAEDGHSPPPDVYERVLAKLDKLKEGE